MAISPPNVQFPSGPAALLLSAAQLAALNGLALNQSPQRGLVGSLNNGATQAPLSLTSNAPSTSSQDDLPGNNGGSAYNVVFDVTVEEQHTDELTITDHPVEQGAAITDNAYKNPAMLVLQCGFSASGSVKGNLFSGGAGNPADVSNPLLDTGDAFIRKMYQFLLQIQIDRTPMTVYTGKRTYSNMLLKSIATNSSDKTEHSLPLTLVFREVILVQTSAVTVTTVQSLQSAPEETTPTVQTGTKQLAPADLYVPNNRSLAGSP